MTLGVVPSAWVPKPAVAAVILVAGKGYLLQHRDRRPPKKLHYFLDTIFNFGFVAGPLARSIFEIELPAAAVGKLKLLEGPIDENFSPATLQSDLLIVPCDRFVLDLHMSQRQKQMALRDLT
jgi:hypothetical protein